MASQQLKIFGKLAKLAWRNILRNWRHGLATTLAIATGFMAISLFDGFIRELVFRSQDGFTNKGMLGHLLIQKKDAAIYLQEDPWQYSMSHEEQIFLDQFFANDPAFVERVRFLNLSGMINVGDTNAIFSGFGYDIKAGTTMRGKRWSWDTIAGKPLHLSDPQAVILGGNLGEMLGCSSTFDASVILPDGNLPPDERNFRCQDNRMLLSATTETAQINTLNVVASGLFDAGFREVNKRAIELSLEDAQKLLDTDKITMVSVRLKDSSEVEGFIARLQKAANEKQFSFDATVWLEHPIANSAKGGIELLSVFRNLFMTIVIIISVMAIANTMMKSVNERIREIGTLRSIGYLRRHITFIFACEGLFISLIACSAGLLLTIVISHLIGTLGITYKAGMLSLPIHLRVLYAPSAWVFSGSFLTLLATGTAWLCARKASKMVVAHAVHHV